MNTTTNTTKRIELGVNTKNVKVQFNTSKPEFRETIGKYWVAVVELADLTKVYANNVKILSESVATLTERQEQGLITPTEELRLASDVALLEEYTQKFKVFREEVNTRFEECYKLIGADLYPAYNTYARTQDKNDFVKALGYFLVANNIQVTPTLVDFLLGVVGLRKAPANTKVKSKGTTLLIAHTERTFKELFMHALSQLMVDKNCIKTEQYTFTYESASVTHIYSKVDELEVSVEEEKTEDVVVPEEEEVVEYATMPLAELRKAAKDKGVKGYSKMKKDELITILAVAIED